MAHRSTNRLLAVIAGAAALLALSGAPSAGAEGGDSKDGTTHCVAHVVGQARSGELLLGTSECFGTFGAAMESLGFAEADTPQRAAGDVTIQSTLAAHFDGFNWTGSSFTVTGADCLGGYVNMTAAWDNRVSSTFGGVCPRIRHFTGTNKTGSSQDTTNSGNLSSPVNNAVSSIQYLT